MARLPGKVKNKVGFRDQIVDQGSIANIANMDGNAVLNVSNIEPVAPIFGNQIVNHGDMGPKIDQLAGNM